MAATQNVLILTSGTGGGHRSAAQALEDSLTAIDPGRVLVMISQVLEEAHVIPRHLASVYNYLLRHHQDWMKYYYWVINHCKPNESRLILKAALKYGLHLFERVTPDVVVSVHPMTQHFYSYVLRRLGLVEKIPLVTVVTDPYYGFWRGWACEDVSHYYVASQDARRQLIDYGVDAGRISISGMPVHSRFQPVTDLERRLLRHRMGLDPDKFTVFLNAGWIGGGNVPKIYEALSRSSLDIQVIFLAGRNDRLIRDARKIAEGSDFPVHVVGFSNEIQDIMNASDVMVSKLGGLTTFEALACNLPIIADVVTAPMPQEEETTRFIEASGAGCLLHTPDKIVPVLKSLMDSPEECDMMRQAARASGKPGASDHIAKEILGIIRS